MSVESHISPLDHGEDTIKRIPLDGIVGVFREGVDVYADTPDGVVELDIRDPTVSGTTGGEPPVELVPRERGVEIRNNGNKNGVTVDTGVETVTVPVTDPYRITSSATVEVGRRAALRLTVEGNPLHTLDEEERADLGLVERGSVVEGVEPAAYVSAVADNLRQAGTQSANEVLKYATELHNFVNEHPVDAAGYESAESTLQALVTQLESKVSGGLRDGNLDDQRLAKIDRVADEVERLYARRGGEQ